MGELTELGVDTVILREEMNDLEAIQNQLSPSGVDIVADIVGGDHVPLLIEFLRPGGRYVTVGAVAGPMVTVDWRRLYLEQLTLLGSTTGT